jgi:16S rRNA G1207 methylase RsmC
VRDGVDPGTLTLLRHAPRPAAGASVVDLGAGYGPIAVTLARREPLAGVWAVEVNERALALVRVNAASAGVSDVIAGRTAAGAARAAF